MTQNPVLDNVSRKMHVSFTLFLFQIEKIFQITF